MIFYYTLISHLINNLKLNQFLYQIKLKNQLNSYLIHINT